MNTPILETDRMILCPFREDDVKDVFECWESAPDVAKYMFRASSPCANLGKSRDCGFFDNTI